MKRKNEIEKMMEKRRILRKEKKRM